MFGMLSGNYENILGTKTFIEELRLLVVLLQDVTIVFFMKYLSVSGQVRWMIQLAL